MRRVWRWVCGKSSMRMATRSTTSSVSSARAVFAGMALGLKQWARELVLGMGESHLGYTKLSKRLLEALGSTFLLSNDSRA